MSMINFVLSWIEHGKCFITLGLDLYLYFEYASSKSSGESVYLHRLAAELSLLDNTKSTIISFSGPLIYTITFYIDSGITFCIDSGITFCIDSGITFCIDSGIIFCIDSGITCCIDSGIITSLPGSWVQTLHSSWHYCHRVELRGFAINDFRTFTSKKVIAGILFCVLVLTNTIVVISGQILNWASIQ